MIRNLMKDLNKNFVLLDAGGKTPKTHWMEEIYKIYFGWEHY